MHSGSFNVIYITFRGFILLSYFFASYLKHLLLQDSPRQAPFNSP
jgi:hypothetical protein